MGSSGEKEWSSGFGFNDVDFSDRVLRLEIAPLLPCNTSDDSNTSEIGATTGLKVKKIHVSSLVLSSRSPFFYKLLLNGMNETQQRYEVALKINEPEEEALMHLLKFMYGIPLAASSAQDLVDLSMVADKFEVPSCISSCVDLLLKLPMSTEVALVCIALPSTLKADEAFQTLMESAKKSVCAHFMDFTKSQQTEAMELPLSAVVAVLGGDGLKVDSENQVFDFALRWARQHYPDPEERREVLTNRLAPLICFANMSCSKLKSNATCPDFDQERMSELVINALSSKLESPYGRGNSTFPRRMYYDRIVKVVNLKRSQPSCVVYFDLTKEDFVDFVPSDAIYSQTFFLGGESFSLSAKRTEEEDAFGLFVNKHGGSESCTLDVRFLATKEDPNQFTHLGKSVNDLQRNKGYGHPNVFNKLWKEFLEDDNHDSVYFIDGILHLRADITLIK